MYVCLARNSFFRAFGENGYINNQLTKLDRVYDEHGKIFLEHIKRQPQSVEKIAQSLASLYVRASADEIERDFVEFVHDLEKDGFVIVGESETDVLSKMDEFRYSDADAKTLARTKFDFAPKILPDTTNFLGGYLRQHPRIFSFQMELTSRCNEKCRHCYLPGTRDFHDMETPLVMSLLDQLRDMGTLGLTISGGECLLHKDFIPILEKARENDFSISILSNVTLLNDELIRAIKSANINLLQVSVYSMNPEEHDWVTQINGSHKATMNALERLIEADIPVQISCPTMQKTYKSYKDVLDWAYKHRVKGYTDFIMMARTDQSADNLDNRLSLEQTKELLLSVIDKDIEYKALLDSATDFTIDENLAEKPVCGACTDSMCVAANGDFYPCAGFQGYPLGNAHRQSIKDVWTNSEAVERLRNVTWKEFPQCLKCEAKPFCAMCMVRNFNEMGELFSVSKHFCDVAFLNKQIAEEYRGASRQ